MKLPTLKWKEPKITVFALGGIYIPLAVSMIAGVAGMERALAYTVKYAILSSINITVILSLILGKKKGEIIALAGIFVFLSGLYLSVLIGIAR